mgnify:CR=1 FL=1
MSFVHRRGDLRIEARVRLVVEDDLRIGDQGAREPDALLHPAGDLRGNFSPAVGIWTISELLAYALLDLPSSENSGVLAQGERQVLRHREPVDQRASWNT